MKTSDKFRASIAKDHHRMPMIIAAGLLMDQLDELLAEFRPKEADTPPDAKSKKKS